MFENQFKNGKNKVYSAVCFKECDRALDNRTKRWDSLFIQFQLNHLEEFFIQDDVI